MITIITHDGKLIRFFEDTQCLLATEQDQPSVYPPRGRGYRAHRFVDDGSPTISLSDAIARDEHWIYLDCGRSIARGQDVWTKCRIDRLTGSHDREVRNDPR